MSTSHLSTKSRGDTVHPESPPQLGKFISSAKRRRSTHESDPAQPGENKRNSLVASMIQAFDSQSAPPTKDRLGDSKSTKHQLPIKRAVSSGTTNSVSTRSPAVGVRSAGGRAGTSSGGGENSRGKAATLGLVNGTGVKAVSPGIHDDDSSTDDSYSSSSESEEEEEEVQPTTTERRQTRVTRSLGRNVRSVTRIQTGNKPAYTLHDPAPRLSGKIITLPQGAEKGADPRAQRAIRVLGSGKKAGGKETPVSPSRLHSKGPVVKPLGVASTKAAAEVTLRHGTSKKTIPDPTKDCSPPSSISSKTETTSLATLSADRTDDPTAGRSPSPSNRRSRIELNPFFQQDQLNKSGNGLQALKDLNRERTGSAPPPAAASGKPLPEGITSSVRETRSATPKDDKLGKREELSREPSIRGASAGMTIQDRIKLWADKERLEKERKLKQASPKLQRTAKSERDVREGKPEVEEDKHMKTAVTASALQVDDFYDDIIAPGKEQIPEVGSDEEYDDVRVSQSRRSKQATREDEEDSDEFYEDLEKPLTRQQRTTSAPPSSLRAINIPDDDSLYAEIPGSGVHPNTSRDDDTPPKLPPRPKSMKLYVQQALQDGNSREMEELYDEVEFSETNSPSFVRRLLPGRSAEDGPAKKAKGRKKGDESDKQSKPKWKNFRSPRLGRRKKEKGKMERKVASVESNTEEERSPRKANKIASRSASQRKAVKRRSSGEPESPEEEPVLANGDNESQFPSASSPIPINGAAGASEDPPSYTIIRGNQLDPSSGEVIPVIREPVVFEPQPSSADNRLSVIARKRRKDLTLSREIYGIIDAMGSQQCFEPVEEESLTVEDSEALLSSGFLSAPANLRPSRSDPALHIHSILPNGHADLTSRNESGASFFFQNGITLSGDSSSESPNSTRNSLDLDESSPSLDPITARRLELKRQRHVSGGSSYPGKTIMNQKYLSGAPQRKESVTSLEEGVIATPLMYADAVWDRVAMEGSDELSFRAGDVIEILDMTDDIWWHGSVGDTSGWFLASFVRLRVGQDSGSEMDDEDKAKTADPQSRESDSIAPELPAISRYRHSSTIRRRMTIRRKDTAPAHPKKLSPAEVRAKVVEEVLNTERDYVRHLGDIVEGYLVRCRDYTHFFDEERLETIFSNIEQVYHFQQDFLRELEARVKHDKMEQSQIGEVFVLNQHEFSIYADYCNNHPHAVNEMNTLQQIDQYALFFESCRLLRNLEDISLEGFLLLPVQKICKYPLQLSELLKYTGEDHPDYVHVRAAVEAMKDVATLVNEQKRRMENIGKIGQWQETIENWKGRDILETSTELIHSGDLHKISKGHSQERKFFLFDHQLIYCKKESIGGKLVYKGRVDIGNCDISDLPDGAVMHGSNAVKNAWKMHNEAKDKWYVIYAKTAELKAKWMDAFRRERERVREDEEKNFSVTMKMKRAAVTLAGVRVERRKRRRSFHKKHAFSTESVDGAQKYHGRRLVVSGQISPNKVRGRNKRSKTPGAGGSSGIIRKL